jgi:DNA invertase Pin-like site-specific DNA recombinase
MAVKRTSTQAPFPQVVGGADLDRRAVLYSRVSTPNGQDPEMQSREIREYCLRRGWPLVGEYVDIGISGAKERRPQLDRLIADASSENSK